MIRNNESIIDVDNLPPLLLLSEVAAIARCSVKTAYSRAKSGYYKKQKGHKRGQRVLVVRDSVLKQHGLLKTSSSSDHASLSAEARGISAMQRMIDGIS